MTGFTLIGVPSSAGAHGIGQEQAPLQLRRAGLAERLLAAGIEITDEGDLPLALYRTPSPDRHQQNLDQVVTVAQRVAGKVEHIVAGGRVPIVLGGDCTITLGVLAGLQRHHPQAGLVYFDGDVDLNTPATTRSGILDGMGVAHLLGDGAPALAGLGPSFPMLSAERLVLFGFDPAILEPAETERLRRSRLAAWPVNKIVGRPEEAAAEALASLAGRAGPLLVHFDVDAIDSTDLPLANYPHFNLGQSFDSAMTCLATFCANPRFAGLAITEVNPDHDADGTLLTRLIDGIVTAMAGAARQTMS
jgi:arginase